MGLPTITAVNGVTLTYNPPARTETVICTNMDIGVYQINLSAYNFYWYNYSVNAYQRYTSLWVSTDGIITFSDVYSHLGSLNNRPTNSIRFLSVDATTTLKYYIINNELYISAVGSLYNSPTNLAFTIIIKITQDGLFRVYYSSIGTSTRNPIIGWAGSNNTSHADDVYYSTFDGVQLFNQSAINGKTLDFDFRDINITTTNNPLCFLQGTKILTNNGYIPIEQLQKDDLIQTYKHGFVPLEILGSSTIYNPNNKLRYKDRLYKYTSDKYSELIEELIITGGHSILVDELTPSQIVKNTEYFGGDHWIQANIDNKRLLMSFIDEKSETYEKDGLFTVWHLTLEHENDLSNYGIYANGLLVEACPKRYMKCSMMKFIESV